LIEFVEDEIKETVYFSVLLLDLVLDSILAKLLPEKLNGRMRILILPVLHRSHTKQT